MQPKIFKASSYIHSDSGSLIEVTPEKAGWRYIGFELVKLHKHDQFIKETGEEEYCIVVLSGLIDIKANGQEWKKVGSRANIFEKIKPYSIYIPPASKFQLQAITDAEIALCKAPAEGKHEARLITPEDVSEEIRGQGHMQRQIHNILPEDKAAESLLIVEVFTPNGHWSSYPPHKHDENNLPHESYLEEVYYHRMMPENGFAFQRVYSDDRSIDQAYAVENGDVVLVPKGYHPVSAAPGYDLYYLNVMAGPSRTWKFTNDRDLEWLMR